MYGFDYELEPATEGIGSFFSMVLDKIKAAGEKIKDWIDQVALKIKRMTGRTSAEQSKKDSAEALKKIDDIGSKIADILDNCSTQINRLYEAFQKVAAGTETDKAYRRGAPQSNQYGVNKGSVEANRNSTAVKRGDKYYDITSAMTAKGGMDKISSDFKSGSAELKDWENTKQSVALALASSKGDAEKVSADLKSLASYGPLGIDTTKKGYNKLREIFNANGTFGAQWKKVKIAAEWSTGTIKEALNKVVSMYDVGIRATDAFGARLTRGFVRNENGEKMKKEDLKGVKSTYKFANKVYAGNKSDRNISTDRKAGNFRDTQFGRSGKQSVDNASNFSTDLESANYVLDRIYQMAYEDAKEDIKLAQEALNIYDSIPGAYEFVEESVDPEFEMDYDPLYEQV